MENSPYRPEQEDGENAGSRPIAHLPKFDPERYRPLLGDKVDEEAANELLRTLWSIMCTFVQLGWGVESVQKVLPFMRDDAKVTTPEDDSN